MNDDLVNRLDNLWAMLEEEGHYVKANTAVLAKNRIKELEAERDTAYETAVREAAAQAMKWLDDPDDDASLSGYILSLIGDDDG